MRRRTTVQTGGVSGDAGGAIDSCTSQRGHVGDDRVGFLDGDLDDRAHDCPIACEEPLAHRTEESCSGTHSFGPVARYRSRIQGSAVDDQPRLKIGARKRRSEATEGHRSMENIHRNYRLGIVRWT